MPTLSHTHSTIVTYGTLKELLYIDRLIPSEIGKQRPRSIAKEDLSSRHGATVPFGKRT